MCVGKCKCRYLWWWMVTNECMGVSIQMGNLMVGIN